MARVLVVDDEEDMRRVVGLMLKNAGHDAVLAVDGNDALQQFERQHFDLVICDIFMPNKEGIETLRELRGLDPALPVIMMSGGAPSVHLWGTTHIGFPRGCRGVWRYPDDREAIQILAASQAGARVSGGWLAVGEARCIDTGTAPCVPQEAAQPAHNLLPHREHPRPDSRSTSVTAVTHWRGHVRPVL